MSIACNKAREGDKEEALKFLKKAIASHPKLIRYAKNDDAFNNLKGDIRFKKLTDLDYGTQKIESNS
jgi:hypothetical protein